MTLLAVSLVVTMPYTKEEFDKTKQDAYIAAIATAAGAYTKHTLRFLTGIHCSFALRVLMSVL